MFKRKYPLVVGGVYHVFSKSIAGFKIFNNNSEFSRMIATIRYYQKEKPSVKFSKFIKLNRVKEKNPDGTILLSNNEKLLEVIAYCLMPTHLHLILKQLKESGITIFMSNILNSYTRYFNTKHNRKGPLWESRFKNVLVETDEQLFHLTRYVHLNPVTAYLVNKPEEWLASSYKEYVFKVVDNERICKYDDVLEVDPNSYREFVQDMVSYQRELATLKNLFFE
ncbi:MAG: hypothetical protein SCARUB_01311 [Candidatus Scalindua rubra]|uniref:Transposase IS200-like domain-containing protein n=1 Tax=Candidatus Scalindua rubra TaxID=1872076 RepID=A0A1E3XD64_9BACT|nr:MAG: hypothetical protein SCARUB_01311 [Candidatus Scalindua rubra]